MSTGSASSPANSGSAACRFLSFTKAVTRSPAAPFRRSRACRAAPICALIWAAPTGSRRRSATGSSSTVETAFIRMSLDHDTGAMTGTVLQGRFAGMRLEELRPPELLALLRECRAEDEESARLLEAYLDRVRANWHDEMAGEQGQGGPRQSSPEVTVDEAYAILGLAPGADAEAVKAAHHRLMKQLHPDHGG